MRPGAAASEADRRRQPVDRQHRAGPVTGDVTLAVGQEQDRERGQRDGEDLGRQQRQPERRQQQPGGSMGAPGASEPGHDDAGIFRTGSKWSSVRLPPTPVERPLIVEGRHGDEGQQQQPEHRQRPKPEATPPKRMPMAQDPEVRAGRRRRWEPSPPRTAAPAPARPRPPGRPSSDGRHPQRDRQGGHHDRVELGEGDPRGRRHQVVADQQRRAPPGRRPAAAPRRRSAGRRRQASLLEQQEQPRVGHERVERRDQRQDRRECSAMCRRLSSSSVEAKAGRGPCSR